MISVNSNEYNTKISERVDLFSCNTSEQKENTSSKVHLQLSGKGATSDFDQIRVHVRLELHSDVFFSVVPSKLQIVASDLTCA
jgi:hypothetical protein